PDVGARWGSRVGRGVSVTSPPAAADQPAPDPAAAGAPSAAETLLAALSAKMLGRLAQWNRGEGFSTIRADWLARAIGVGEDVRVRLAEHELAGRFEALDESGGLVLGLPDGGTMTIAAGEVFLDPPPASLRATR